MVIKPSRVTVTDRVGTQVVVFGLEAIQAVFFSSRVTVGELRPPQHPGFENQNQETGGARSLVTTDFLFILDVESFHIVPASSSCGGVCFGQPERQIWGKGETMENSRQEAGKLWAFSGIVETVRRASAPMNLGHTLNLCDPTLWGFVQVPLHGRARLNPCF